MDNQKKNLSYKVIIIIVVGLILIDQLSKIIAVNRFQNSVIILDGILNFTYTQNTGGAFGIGSGNVFMFILTNIIVIGLIIKFLITQKKMMDKKTQVLLSLILAGGISNLIDRVFRGFVVDFIDLAFFDFPVFNIADICVVSGWIMLVIVTIIYAKGENKKKEVKNNIEKCGKNIGSSNR